MMDIDITHNEWREENKSQIFRRPTQILTEPKFPGSAPFKSMPGCLAIACLFRDGGQNLKFLLGKFLFFPKYFPVFEWLVGIIFVSLEVSDIIHIASITTLGVRKFKYLPSWSS